MGQPVVHFEIMGQDADKLQSFYSELFDWQLMSDNPVNYVMIERAENLSEEGVGIGGGIGQASGGYSGHVTFYVEVPDVEAALAKAESLGGSRITGPRKLMEQEVGLFTDPEGHTVGVVKSMPKGLV